jgi:hypothetical protein
VIRTALSLQQRSNSRFEQTSNISIFPDIRLQLNEQLRCLDLRMEAQVALVTELQDFFPPERRTRTRLFEELGQVGEKSPTQAQRTETKVIIRRSRLDRVA